MRKLPINDFMTKDGSVREDGRVIRDMYLMQVQDAGGVEGRMGPGEDHRHGAGQRGVPCRWLRRRLSTGGQEVAAAADSRLSPQAKRGAFKATGKVPRCARDDSGTYGQKEKKRGEGSHAEDHRRSACRGSWCCCRRSRRRHRPGHRSRSRFVIPFRRGFGKRRAGPDRRPGTGADARQPVIVIQKAGGRRRTGRRRGQARGARRLYLPVRHQQPARGRPEHAEGHPLQRPCRFSRRSAFSATTPSSSSLIPRCL